MNTYSSIQGQLLDVTVVTCSNLKDTKVLGRQASFVRLEYANSKFRTNTCSGGGKNPTFQETFQIPLIQGLRELEIAVWRSKTFGRDIIIGTGRIQLDKVISQGYDDSSWPIRTEDLRAAGELKLIMHYSGASHNPSTSISHANPPAPPYGSLPPYARPPPPSVYPNVGGYLYTVPPSAPPPYPGTSHPPPPMTNPNPPPPTAYPPPGPYPGGYPPPY